VVALLAVDPERQLIVLGRLLNGERRNDARVVKVLRGLVMIPSCLRTINLFISRNIHLLDGSLNFMTKSPGLLDFSNKMRSVLPSVRCFLIYTVTNPTNPIFTPNRYLEEKLRSSVSVYNLYGGMDVRLPSVNCWRELSRKIISGQFMGMVPAMFQFSNNMAMGPGVEREVLSLISRDLVSENEEDEPLFQAASDKSSYEPRPFHWLFDMDRRFEAVGELMGHCIRYKKLLPIQFNSCFIKMVLRHPVGLSDLKDLDEMLHKNLQWVLDGEAEVLEAQEMTFSWAADDQKSEVALCPGGLTKKVTDENREEFVQLVLKHHTTGKMGTQAEAVRRGILNVIPMEGLLNMLSEPEFSTILAGVHELDVMDWKQHTQYGGGYSSASHVILWYWRFVESLSQEEKALLLKFCTGTSSTPVGGFGAMTPPFNITRYEYNPKAPISTAATCFHQLKLEAYPSYAALEKNMLLAIRFGSEGFSFV